MLRVHHTEVRGVRHRGKIGALVVAVVLTAPGCVVDTPYEPLDQDEAPSTTVAPSRDRIDCGTVLPMEWLVAPTDTSAVDLVRNDQVPPIPGTEAATGNITASLELGSIDGVLAEMRAGNDLDERAALELAGFETGITTGFGTAEIPHRVRVLRFREAKGALQYANHQRTRICGLAGTTVVPLDDQGVIYPDGNGGLAAVFTIGREQVTLILPQGTEGDMTGILLDWHQAWLDAIATGPPAPVS
jgi:hypothetical protein